MKPCDTYDSVTAGKLREQGLVLNEWGILVKPLSVIIYNSNAEIRVPQSKFKAFAQWYLKDQERGDND